MRPFLSGLGWVQLAVCVIYMAAGLGVWATSTSSVTNRECNYQAIGDGYCNPYNNREECHWDGGDCCECTCEDSTYPCGSGEYDCKDPDAPVECDCYEEAIGDGYCNPYNNREECHWDGGDCCECTCEDSTYPCGSGGYDCKDPDAPVDCD